MNIQLIRSAFEQRFDHPCNVIIRSPGRVNILGGHTDYNGGWVLPYTLEQAIYIGVAFTPQSGIRAYSENLNQWLSISMDETSKAGLHWRDCIVGIFQKLKGKITVPISGIDLYISSALPIGGGLSSSSALCCGLAMAFCKLFDLQLSRSELVQLAYEVEHDFIGISCGYMDQLAIVNGVKDKASLIDCRTNKMKPIAMDMAPHFFVLIQSNVKRSLHTTDYSKASEDCADALRIVREAFPETTVLSDLSFSQLKALESSLSFSQNQRIQYVLEENTRVLLASKDLASSDIGRLMTEGHLGLKKLYGVTCPEVDFLVEKCSNAPHILGSRMMGGGFGGCVLVLLEHDKGIQSVQQILEAYAERFSLKAELLTANSGNGLECIY